MKLKRKCFVILPLAGVFLLCHHACQKDEGGRGTGKEVSNAVVYEDKTLEEQVSPYFYENHIYRIELLGANRERERVVREALEEGLDKEFMLIEESRKFFFNHCGVIMYSIPTLDPEQTVILYLSEGLFQVSMACFRPAEAGRMAFTLKTMDDRAYFSLKLDDQMRMGELRVFENAEIKSFNKSVYSLTFKEESQEATAKGADAICCRRESSWAACMNCTIDDCQDSWVCKAVAIIAPVELVAGFAASCIGAGPDAKC